MQKKNFLYFMLGSLILSGIVYFSSQTPIVPQDSENFGTPVSSAYTNEVNDQVINSGATFNIHGSFSSGNSYYFYVETHLETQGLDVFVCTESNYNLYIAGSSASVYHLNEDIHTCGFSFTIPSSGVWYFVASNRGGITTVTADILLDYNGDDVPSFSSALHDYVTNGELLNVGEYYALSGTFTDNDQFSGRFETYFSTDGLDFFLVDATNYARFQSGLTYTRYGTALSYHAYSIPTYSFPDSGTWYFVFSAKSATDSVRVSLYLDIEIGSVEDSYEENDFISSAKLLSAGDHPNLFLGDEDWYKIYVDNCALLEVSVSYSGVESDIDLALYDSSFSSLVDEINNSGSGSGIEFFEYESYSAGYYYLKVFSAAYSGIIYELDVDISINDDNYENNDDINTAAVFNYGPNHLICRDEDWFEYELDGGTDYEISISFDNEGDLDLYIYTGSGELINSSASSNNHEEIIYSALGDETIYIQVINFSGLDDYFLYIDEIDDSDSSGDNTIIFNGEENNGIPGYSVGLLLFILTSTIFSIILTHNPHNRTH